MKWFDEKNVIENYILKPVIVSLLAFFCLMAQSQIICDASAMGKTRVIH